MCVQDKPPAQTDLASEPELPRKEEEASKEDPKAIFTVTIVGARVIRKTDALSGPGKPKCYCEVKRGDTLLHKTKTVDNSAEPRWAEEFGVLEYEIGESLEFKVWDSNVVEADYLGKVILTPDAFMENGCNMEFPMEEAEPNIRAYLGLKIKVMGQHQYPAGPPPSFEVTVEKGGGAMQYGLDVDRQDLKHLQILKVVDGAIKQYNEQVKLPWQVIQSDFVVSVNGVAGDAVEMLKQFQADQVNLKLARAFDTVAYIQNGKKKQHGLKFPKQMKNNILVVMEIGDGYIKEHNDKCEDESQKIFVYDRIVSVNRQVGTAATLKSRLEKASGKFQLGIQRPYAASNAPGGVFGF